MSLRLITSSLFSIRKAFSIPAVIINRSVSTTGASYEWKILALGAGNKVVPEAQKSLESDQKVIAALKEQQWDAISIGDYVNGFDQSVPYHVEDVPTDRADILHWFNRLLNVIHQLAPKSKIILVKSPQDIHDGIQRIMVKEQKQN
ncbi:unnamed protein product [Adineta steineri]|uniref:Uncharacterized protein n=1 Tax=Adineta steineri TaxID=433720 RepID=A0A814ASK0_9BILA|nr:unnamed protein product [Adineta steineri]CAF0919099.1 unnamed protein product [Adineta steineri]